MPTYKHGEKWRTIATFNYKQKTKVTRTKREGEVWEAEMLRFMQQTDEQIKQAVTFKQVIERYRDEITPTKRGHRWEFIRLEAFLKSSLPITSPIQQITPDALGRWRDERLLSVSSGTVLRDFGLLSAVFEHARREWGYIDTNPLRDVRKPREPDHRTTTYTRKQIKAILKELGYHPHKRITTISQSIAMCFLTALRTGMRAGELTGLKWDKVKDGYCILPKTKTVPRDVPLSTKAQRLIKRMQGFDDVSVFALKPQTLDALFRRARDNAGIEGVTFHDTRHTAATWMSKKVDVLTLCKIFGWKNTAQALTYYNPKAKDIAKMLD